MSQKGLAYQSVIGENGTYDFTDLGISVVCYGIEYDDLDCNKDLLTILGSPIFVSTGMRPMSSDEVNGMLTEIWGEV